MPPVLQIAIDCHDPHRLVRFWAAAMDLEVEAHDAQIRELLEVARLLDLGATRLWEGEQGPHRWITLADPEGNEFCVA